jgi:hypothetical protein
VSRAFGNGSAQDIGGVGHAGRGVGLPPEFENPFYIIQPGRTDG